MIHVKFDHPGGHLLTATEVRRAARAALLPAGSVGDGLTIILSNDERLQDLNRTYLGFDAPTDVLSFPAGDLDPESGERYLGDVIISVDRAAAQAEARRHSPGDEIRLLIIHGVLHLLGHDHVDPQGKTRMWSAQQAALETLGLSPDIVHE